MTATVLPPGRFPAASQPRRKWPWYPALIALAWVASPYAEDPIDVTAGLRTFAVVVAIALVITVVWVVTIGRDRGGATAAITVVGLVIVIDPARLLVVLLALGLVVTEAVWSRRGGMRLKVPWPRFTSTLNVLLVALLAVMLVRGAVLRATLPLIPVSPSWTASEVADAPDVFVIIADGHGRRDVLRDRYGYDMVAFEAVLTDNGFTPSPASFANHSQTRYSMAVLLNGRPLSELGQDMAARADEHLPQAALMRSSGASLLRDAGYDVTLVTSEYEHLAMRDIGRFVDVGPRNENEQAYMLASGGGRVVDELTGGYVDAAASRVRRQLEALREIARSPTDHPQFVLVHLGLPHWPFVLNADCTDRPFDYRTPGTQARGWVAGDEISVQISADQTRCIDAQLASAIPDVVAARPNAVVIVLSDHGPEERLDWWHPDEQGTHDRLANLFWARTPGHAELFPTGISLVNVLPTLANAYLGTALLLHPNDLYFGPGEASTGFIVYQPPAMGMRGVQGERR